MAALAASPPRRTAPWHRPSGLVGVGVDPGGVDQDGDTALFGHDAVVGVPVGVLPARGGEDGPEQAREVVGVETGQPIVRAGELGGAIEADPGPSGAPGQGQRGSAPQVSELHRPIGDECATCAPVTGCATTAALTSEEWGVPSERRVLTTAR